MMGRLSAEGGAARLRLTDRPVVLELSFNDQSCACYQQYDANYSIKSKGRGAIGDNVAEAAAQQHERHRNQCRQQDRFIENPIPA